MAEQRARLHAAKLTIIDEALNGTERHRSLTFYKNFKWFP